jgi:thiol-disulfide isomerase/thioredoxin
MLLNLIYKYPKVFLSSLFLLIFSVSVHAQAHGILPQGPPNNSFFPDFKYVSIDGDSINSSDLEDKIVIVNIWFVGCKGCKQEEPYLRKVTEEYQGDEEVVFLGFCMSKPERIKNYLEQNGEIGYTNISLSREEVEKKYKVKSSPTHFFIKNGVLINKYTGPIVAQNKSLSWFQEEIRKLKN